MRDSSAGIIGSTSLACGARDSARMVRLSLRSREEGQEPDAHVLVHQQPLARQLERIPARRLHHVGRAPFAASHATIDDVFEERLEVPARDAREQRRSYRTVAGEGLAEPPHLVGHGHGAPPEGVDGDEVTVDLEDIAPVEAGERLQLVPRRVASEGVGRDRHLDRDRVRAHALFRKGTETLHSRRDASVDLHPYIDDGCVLDRIGDKESLPGGRKASECHEPVTETSPHVTHAAWSDELQGFSSLLDVNRPPQSLRVVELAGCG